MSDERKIENQIVNFSVSQNKATICHRNEQKKRHHMVTKSRQRWEMGIDGF